MPKQPRKGKEDERKLAQRPIRNGLNMCNLIEEIALNGKEWREDSCSRPNLIETQVLMMMMTMTNITISIFTMQNKFCEYEYGS